MAMSIGSSALSMKRTDPATELALIERCRRQDAEAFSVVVDAYQNRVFGFVRRMVGDADESADIAQEVFVRAYQSFGRFDGRSSLRTWLFRIAHNLCIDRARKLGRSPDTTSLDAGSHEDEATFDVPDQRWDPELTVLNDELFAVVDAAVGTLSDKLKTVLLLHDREDFAYEEIAQTLDLPVGTVKSRLFLARAHLQKVVGAYLNGERL
jgi:RNA polymerase sigma-70 factor (ECF subfamily)